MPALRPDGRWGGAITSRPLPDATDELEALAPPVRDTLARVWWMQAATEGRVATSFALVHRSLVALDADPGLIAIAERAVDDEHRHAALCEELARRYAGRALPPSPALEHAHPAHPEARSDEERAALYVVGQCAFNETLACAYLNLARAGCTSSLARAAIRELLEDEVDHSRVGWAFLASAPAPVRARLGEWLLPLAVCNLREWLSLTEAEGLSLAAHGVPDPDALRDALHEGMRGVILPGLAHVGLDTRAVERWVARGMPMQ